MQSTGKATKFCEMARCFALNGNWQSAANYAEHTMPWFKEVNGAIKAAVGGSSLADLQANPDYNGAVESFIESLRPRCVFDSLTLFMVEVPLRSAVFTATLPPEGSVTGEGTPRPITKLDFSRNVLATLEASTIAIFSREGLEYSGGKALVNRELSSGTIQATDTKFLSGLLSDVGSNTESGTGDPAADIKTLLDTVATTGSEALFLIVPPTVANVLATTVDTNGLPLYPDMTANGGTLFGIRTMVTSNLPADDSTGSTILLVDASGIAFGQETITLKSSDAGLVDLSDDPDGSNLVSLFQEDIVAIKATRFFGFDPIRSTAVAAMTGVDWS
jgi:HK97 family phage major capsid protein